MQCEWRNTFTRRCIFMQTHRQTNTHTNERARIRTHTQKRSEDLAKQLRVDLHLCMCVRGSLYVAYRVRADVLCRRRFVVLTQSKFIAIGFLCVFVDVSCTRIKCFAHNQRQSFSKLPSQKLYKCCQHQEMVRECRYKTKQNQMWESFGKSNEAIFFQLKFDFHD